MQTLDAFVGNAAQGLQVVCFCASSTTSRLLRHAMYFSDLHTHHGSVLKKLSTISIFAVALKRPAPALSIRPGPSLFTTEIDVGAPGSTLTTRFTVLTVLYALLVVSAH